MPPKSRRFLSRWLVLPFVWGGSCLAQTTTVTQSANDVQCGNVVVKEHGTVNLSCSNLTKDQEKMLQTTIPGLLMKLLALDQKNFAAIEAQLGVTQKDVSKLKDAVREWRLTPDQQTALADSLRRAPSGPVTLVCLACEEDGKSIAVAINQVFKSAGWPALGVNQNTFIGEVPKGIWIQVKDTSTAPAFAASLQAAFLAIGSTIRALPTPTLPENEVQLIVGRKPVPDL